MGHTAWLGRRVGVWLWYALLCNALYSSPAPRTAQNNRILHYTHIAQTLYGTQGSFISKYVSITTSAFLHTYENIRTDTGSFIPSTHFIRIVSYTRYVRSTSRRISSSLRQWAQNVSSTYAATRKFCATMKCWIFIRTRFKEECKH